jgi:propanol-preferring alcohol dehydrogenase
VPETLAAADAAPLCCAGWTAYRAIREAGLEPGAAIAVFGMGGLGHLAVQYARHAGLRVAAVDVAGEKLELAREVGAEITVRADNAGRILQKEHGGMDAAVVLTASVAAIGEAMRALKRCGTLVLVGLAHGVFELPVIETVLRGITIRGSFLGTRADLEEVFRLSAAGIVRTHVERHSLEDTPELLAKMRRGELLGRAVIAF